MLPGRELLAVEAHGFHHVEVDEAHAAAPHAEAGALLDLEAELGVVAKCAEVDAAEDVRRVDLDLAEDAAADEAVAALADEGGGGGPGDGLVAPGEDFVDEVLALLADEVGAAAEGVNDVLHAGVGEAAAGEGAVAHLGVADGGLHEDILGGLLGGAEAHGVEHALEVFTDELEG